MLIIWAWGTDIVIRPLDSIEEAHRLKRSIGGDRDYIIYDSNFLMPARFDRAWRQLDEEEQTEWLLGEAWPAVHDEGRVTRHHGKYVKSVISID